MINWFINLNGLYQGILATIFTYLITLIALSTVFFVKSINNKILDLIMGISSGIMISSSFFSLLNPAIILTQTLEKSGIYIIFGFFFGGMLVILSSCFLEKTIKLEPSKQKSVMLMTSVTLHNIPEGLAIGIAFGTLSLNLEGVSLVSACMLALGIAIQNFPEALCIVFPLRKSNNSKLKAFFYGQCSSIVEIISGILGVLFALKIREFLPFALSFCASCMICVVCSELIPQPFKDNKILASIGVLLGFTLMMSLDIIL